VLSSSERRHRRVGTEGAIALEQCPHRRRRDGATIQARTGEPSSARVRVLFSEEDTLVLSTAEALRGARSREALADAKRDGVLQTPSCSSRRPGCPGRNEKGTREIVQRARVLPFLERSRPALCLIHASGSRRAQAVLSRLRLTGPTMRRRIARANAAGIGWCRRVAERELHSRVRIETLAGCARALSLGCRSRQASRWS